MKPHRIGPYIGPGIGIGIGIAAPLFLVSPAFAHGLVPGPAGFAVAFQHTLTELPLPLALAAFALLIGRHPTETIRIAWPLFAASTIAGIIGLVVWQAYLAPILPLLLLTFVAAAWVASGVAVPSFAAALLGVLFGYFTGVFIAPGPAPVSMQAYAITGGLAATNVTVFAIIAAITLVRAHLPYAWIDIAWRVLASWLAAIAALLSALISAR